LALRLERELDPLAGPTREVDRALTPLGGITDRLAGDLLPLARPALHARAVGDRLARQAGQAEVEAPALGHLYLEGQARRRVREERAARDRVARQRALARVREVRLAARDEADREDLERGRLRRAGEERHVVQRAGLAPVLD